MMNDKEEERYLDRTIDASPVLAQIKGKRHTLPNGHDFQSGWCDETGSLIVCLKENEDSIIGLYEPESVDATKSRRATNRRPCDFKRYT